MRTLRNRLLFTTLTLTLVGVTFSGWLFRTAERQVTAAQAQPEMVCYSLTNKQGWTGGNNGNPPSLSLGPGGTYSQWRFNLNCNRVTGVCRHFGEGSQIFLDFDGPLGPEPEYEQTQLYSGTTNEPPRVATVSVQGITQNDLLFSRSRSSSTFDRNVFG